jgi:hypothetical protein
MYRRIQALAVSETVTDLSIDLNTFRVISFTKEHNPEFFDVVIHHA